MLQQITSNMKATARTENLEQVAKKLGWVALGGAMYQAGGAVAKMITRQPATSNGSRIAGVTLATLVGAGARKNEIIIGGFGGLAIDLAQNYLNESWYQLTGEQFTPVDREVIETSVEEPQGNDDVYASEERLPVGYPTMNDYVNTPLIEYQAKQETNNEILELAGEPVSNDNPVEELQPSPYGGYSMDDTFGLN
jgi:hypothetical protein